jgi:hypothetical protein
MPTAYIKLAGRQGVQPVEYTIGPVLETWAELSLGWFRNSFRPQPTGATWSATVDVQIGEGQSGQFNGGSYISDTSGVTSPVIAVPDEMQSPPIAPRTLKHDKTFLVFYNGLAAGQVFTTNFSGAPTLLTFAAAHNLQNGQLVTVSSAGTLPTGQLAMTRYYIVNRTATQLALALTPGGTPVTLTGNGTGVHTLTPFGIAGFFDMADEPQMGNLPPLGLL